MRFIPLTKGKFTIVDDEDYEWLMQWKWYALKQDCVLDKWRAARSVHPLGRRGPKITVMMHRQIINAQHGQLVDHRNCNPLDNQRSNLRLCNTVQNSRNRTGDILTISGYKGVFFHRRAKPQSKPWQVRCGSRKGFRVYGGYFATPEEAARKYDELAIQMYGEFSCLNFPEEHQL